MSITVNTASGQTAATINFSGDFVVGTTNPQDGSVNLALAGDPPSLASLTPNTLVASGAVTGLTVNGQSLNLSNQSATAQGPIAGGTNTYIAGSNIAIPAAGLRVGTRFRWKISLTKTAAGSASGTFAVVLGTTGTVSDAAILSFTKPAGTAAADEGFIDIDVIVRGPLGASCIATGEFRLVHNLAATGHAQIPCVVVNTVSSTFSSVWAAGQTIGVTTNGGASDAITIQQVSAEPYNL